MKIIVVPEELLRKFKPQTDINLKNEEVISQLKEMMADREDFIVEDIEDFYVKDKKALEYAIQAISTIKEMVCDEDVLNENIEVMRKEIKELEGTTFEPLEKAKAITILSEEIRECINMKNYIALSNRQYESEEATC